MKKLLFVGLAAILAVSSMGCTKTIELTDDENYMIAEYAAELLLKYDKNINLKYYDETVNVHTVTDATATDPDEITTTEAAVSEEAAVDATEEDFDESVTEWTDVSGIRSDETSDFDIAGFAGIDTVSIRYAYYMILDKYPSYDQDGIYMEIMAPEGYKLLVLKFDVENKTNYEQTIDMYDKELEYKIIVNDSKRAGQMLTILIDDLYTYQMVLSGSMREEAVLLFQVSESVADKISDLKLQVTYDGESRVIQLQ